MEQDRMDLHHEILLQLLEGELHKAPIGKTPQRILDVGCGTGIWAIDAADKYPSAEVLGIDLSPLQPKWSARGQGPPTCNDTTESLPPAKQGSFELVSTFAGNGGWRGLT
jgi:SAM-dependent methyltransferase